MSGEVRVSQRSPALACPFCRESVDGDPSGCAGCGVVLHEACWAEVSRCPTAGCGRPVPGPLAPPSPPLVVEPVAVDDGLAPPDRPSARTGTLLRLAARVLALLRLVLVSLLSAVGILAGALVAIAGLGARDRAVGLLLMGLAAVIGWATLWLAGVIGGARRRTGGGGDPPRAPPAPRSIQRLHRERRRRRR